MFIIYIIIEILILSLPSDYVLAVNAAGSAGPSKLLQDTNSNGQQDAESPDFYQFCLLKAEVANTVYS